MNSVTNFLAKFKLLLKNEGALKGEVAGVLSELSNTTIKPSDIKVKDGVVYTNLSPLLKNEIFINKKEILERLREFSIKDIR